jgi:hypothetical protein
MSAIVYPIRLKRNESALFKTAAKRRGISLAEFLRQSARKEAEQSAKSPASLELSRDGFTVREWPGKTAREKIKAAISKRHVSR